MTDVLSAALPAEGTAAHFLTFLDWAEKKGELPSTTVQNWRNASNKVLEVEADWQNLDVVKFDLDAHLARFQTLKRTAYTEGSMSAYKNRTKAAIESYRRWLANPGSTDWKPKAGTPRTAKNGDAKVSKKSPGTLTDSEPKQGANASVGHVPPLRASLIEYPFPLRPGVQARIVLPEDLTEKESKRVSRFVESLAFTEQLAITAGPDVE
ncbi:hypothetical protein SAMN05444157_1267 [Frankineae bacterium MT45]|nr:hypothetical protein SAMN05444157_1267 [Frankineae bacterium MT45]